MKEELSLSRMFQAARSAVSGKIPLSDISHKEYKLTPSNEWYYFGDVTRPHHAVDLGATLGGNIYALGAGKVIASGYDSRGGNGIKILYPKTRVTVYYGHMKSASSFKVGDWVDFDDVVGLVGMTGNTSYSHIHVQVDIKGVRVRPSKLFDYPS